MDWTVCSRETERDYTWDNAHASHPVAECARNLFAPAFEGSLTTSRFAALLRCPGSPSGVMLGVSVSTARKDFCDRPIRTMAFIRAETPDEAELLVVFFAACLRESDAKTLYDADSPLAKAIGNLYQAKKPNDFIEFCKGLSKVKGVRTALTQRWSIPRDNIDDRKKVADVLSSLVGGNESFLVVLTDRTPTDVLGSLGSMFDHATVRIFSKAVDHSENLPEPASQKYRWATAIGGVVILAVAIIGLCFPWDRRGEDKGGGGISAARWWQQTCERRPHLMGCWSCYFCHPQQETTVTNALPSHSGSGGYVTPSTNTNVPQ